MTWLGNTPPPAPVLKSFREAKATVLKWQENNPKKEPRKYVVYRFVNNEPPDLERNDRIVSIQQGTEYTDEDAKHFKQCTYIVTALDRLWNESQPSNKVN
jgi:hypothetical protein